MCRRFFMPLCFCCLLFLYPTILHGHTLDLQTKSTVPFEKFIAELQKVRLVFIGERHDNLSHHQAQLQIIKALFQSNKKIAIGLEMFRKESQDDLDKWVSGNSNPHDFIQVYNDNWESWDQYKDIFLFARNYGVQMIGLNIDRETIRKVAREGFKSLSALDLKSLPKVTCVVDDEYENFIRKAMGTSRKHSETFKNFCEAQLLWDKVMARNLLDSLQKNSEDIIIVLAGNGHSWKYGVPRHIKEKSPYSFKVILPEIPGRLEQNYATPEEADYLLIGTEYGPLH